MFAFTAAGAGTGILQAHGRLMGRECRKRTERHFPLRPLGPEGVSHRPDLRCLLACSSCSSSPWPWPSCPASRAPGPWANTCLLRASRRSPMSAGRFPGYSRECPSAKSRRMQGLPGPFIASASAGPASGASRPATTAGSKTVRQPRSTPRAPRTADHDPNDYGPPTGMDGTPRRGSVPAGRMSRMFTARLSCRSCPSLFNVVAVSRPAGCARQLRSCTRAPGGRTSYGSSRSIRSRGSEATAFTTKAPRSPRGTASAPPFTRGRRSWCPWCLGGRCRRRPCLTSRTSGLRPSPVAGRARPRRRARPPLLRRRPPASGSQARPDTERDTCAVRALKT